MDTSKEQTENIPESSAAKLAFYFAFIPLAGFLFYMAFAFLGLIQIGRGRLGFYRLRNGLFAVLFFSLLPIAGLVWWAELPQEYYVVLNKFTKHGRKDNTSNEQGQPTTCVYFRFGKSFKLVLYDYHKNGTKKYEEIYVDGKQQGLTSRWYDNKQLMSETNYVDGLAEGTSSHWHENGKLRLTENFVNNRRQGLTSWFDKTGKLERSMNYIDGLSQEQIDAAKEAGVPPVIEEDLGGGVKMKLVFIPPGEFMMGSPENEQDRSDDEGPQHKVTIKQGFYLSETELTQAQWQAIMGANPSFNVSGKHGISRTQDTSQYPVERIGWDIVQECLKKLNAKGKGGYRMPSESEWEYAARAGMTTRFGFGDSDNELSEYAWYRGNFGVITHPVATRKSNSWGLFDMHGNVWEWCEDDWHEHYPGAPSDGKAWNDAPRWDRRVIRGGCWFDFPRDCRSAFRSYADPVVQDDYLGVRFAKSLQ